MYLPTGDKLFYQANQMFCQKEEFTFELLSMMTIHNNFSIFMFALSITWASNEAR